MTAPISLRAATLNPGDRPIWNDDHGVTSRLLYED